MRYAYILIWALGTAACNHTRPAPVTKKDPAPEYYKVDPVTAATLRGEVRFLGRKPAAKPIAMDAEEACQKLHKKPVMGSPVTTGNDGGLANSFVYIKSGLDGKTFDVPKQPVVLDQQGCMFVPRVLALQTGQTLAVKNSDPVSHNVNPRPVNNHEWRQQQAPEAPDLLRRFSRPEVLIPVKCNIHSWMRSYIAVLEHPYFAVTDQSGTFEWPLLPPGEYVVAAWHETLGELTQKLALPSQSEQTVRFTFQLK